MSMTRYTKCFTAPWQPPRTAWNAREALRQFNKRNRNNGWIAVAAEPGVGPGTHLIPWKLTVCVRPPRNRKAKWQR